MSCSGPPPSAPPQMPQESPSTSEYVKVDRVLEKVFKFLGMDAFFESWRGGELDKWLESRFPTHLKEHVNMIFVGTAVTGIVVGIFIFYCFFAYKSRKREGYRPVGTNESASSRASLSKQAEEEEGETDDENTPLRILHGRFNKEVISSLHKFNKDNGELIRLGDRSDEDDSEVSDEDDGPPSLEIEEIEDESSEEKQNGEEKKEAPSTGDPIVDKIGTLHGKLATAKIRQESIKMRKKMSADEREEEAKIRAQQLEAIMALMKADKDKFGENSEDLLMDQMESLYNI